VPRHAKDLSWRKLFHGAAVTTGGERSCISAAVSLSTTTIGPAHLGQSQRSLALPAPDLSSSDAVRARGLHAALNKIVPLSGLPDYAE